MPLRKPNVALLASSPKGAIVAALVVQAVALSLFLIEFVGTVFDFQILDISWELHEIIELISILGLVIGSAVTLMVLRNSQRRVAHVEEQLQYATEAFHSLVLQKFSDWGLSDAEQETALLMIKGFSIAEIAEVKSRSTGTIKAQNSSIYQKSGLAGRAQFMSYFMEELAAGL
ncbi:MAG: helix-turn-helix transcriptional regulator [Pelagimonas sp.]|uniref:helix-turn-helix transcriptional regulator n=1 Tax=Pelagimonas sp. TaxID=2073170 RepID=UPI003D6C10F2